MGLLNQVSFALAVFFTSWRQEGGCSHNARRDIRMALGLKGIACCMTCTDFRNAICGFGKLLKNVWILPRTNGKILSVIHCSEYPFENGGCETGLIG